MKLCGLLLFLLLATAGAAFSQALPTQAQDSSFSLLINSGLSFTHANDPHINRWLEKYGYPTEPHVPSSFNFELAAIPASSRLLYSIRLSAINSGRNLSSFNVLAGLYTSLVQTKASEPVFCLSGGLSLRIHLH